MNSSTLTDDSGPVDQTDSGTDLSPSLEHHKPDGYPVPLYTLANYMRKGAWLDIRTDEGPINRVRITEIVVRTLGEDVRFRQEWVEHLDSERKDPKRVRHEIVVDSDAIWKVEPTRYHIDEVEPHGVQIEWIPQPSQSPDLMQRILEAAMQTTMRMYDLSLAQLRHTAMREHLTARYACMLVVFEMSDLSETQITEALGYKSPTPLHSARSEVVWVQGGQRSAQSAHWTLPEWVKRIGNACEATVGRQRRTLPLPPNYLPVLSR